MSVLQLFDELGLDLAKRTVYVYKRGAQRDRIFKSKNIFELHSVVKNNITSAKDFKNLVTIAQTTYKKENVGKVIRALPVIGKDYKSAKRRFDANKRGFPP